VDAKQGDGMVTSSTTVWSQDGSQHDCVVARRSNAVVAKQGDGMVTGQHDSVVVRRESAPQCGRETALLCLHMIEFDKFSNKYHWYIVYHSPRDEGLEGNNVQMKSDFEKLNSLLKRLEWCSGLLQGKPERNASHGIMKKNVCVVWRLSPCDTLVCC
jgi:hypothetical protein